jgi:2,3-bisphosphoglycerate-independent phosphoglycerate mutase
VLPTTKIVEASETTYKLKELIQKSPLILQSHPVNLARLKSGKKPANMIWPWGGGLKPHMPTFHEKYGLRAAVISAVDLVKGIGFYAGMDIVSVVGATGLADTNYEGKADAALKALTHHDFVFVHVEAPDEAGHVRDPKLKVKTIEDLDRRLIGRILQSLNETCAVALLPDHPTPIKVGTHTRDAVPFVIYFPDEVADEVTKFDEYSAEKGSYGLITQERLMSLFVKSRIKTK